MSKLPLILSIVALLCATGLGIATKNKADQKIRELASTRNDLKQSQATLVTRTGELGKANENLAAAGKEIEARGEEVAKLNGDVKATQRRAGGGGASRARRRTTRSSIWRTKIKSSA